MSKMTLNHAFLASYQNIACDFPSGTTVYSCLHSFFSCVSEQRVWNVFQSQTLPSPGSCGNQTLAEAPSPRN